MRKHRYQRNIQKSPSKSLGLKLNLLIVLSQNSWFLLSAGGRTHNRDDIFLCLGSWGQFFFSIWVHWLWKQSKDSYMWKGENITPEIKVTKKSNWKAHDHMYEVRRDTCIFVSWLIHKRYNSFPREKTFWKRISLWRDNEFHPAAV